MTAFMSKSGKSVAVALGAMAMVASLGVVPAVAEPLTDAIASPATSVMSAGPLANQPVAADGSDGADAMPGNPSVALPESVSDKLPDDAVVVAQDYALTPDGALKDIETGRTVTDPALVGTKDRPADPLNKTDGESFIPVDLGEVKEKVDDAAGAGRSAAVASVDKSATDGSASAIVAPAALQNNQYGAYWGTYNESPAFFERNGTLFAQQAKGVIDVSEHQGVIDWQAAKNDGVEGAIIRIGYGVENLDAQAARNISECKRLGIPFGIYLYSYAYDEAFATREGAGTAAMLKNAGVSPADLSYPVYYDLEAWSWAGHSRPTTPAQYDPIVNAWWNAMKQAGFGNLAVYSYTSYLSNELNSGTIHAKTTWVAQYGASMGFHDWPSNARCWQYTSSGHVNGIAGNVDLNAFGTSDGTSLTGETFDVTKLALASVPDGEYYLDSAKNMAYSVEIPAGSGENGVKTALYEFNNAKSQRFRFAKQPDGSYVITNTASGKVLDVYGGGGHDGATVRQWTANGSKAQRWFLRTAGSGYYLQSALGNYVLDVANGSMSNGASVRLWSPNGTSAQTFLLPSAGVMVPTGDVTMQSALNSNYVVDIYGAAMTDNASVQLYSSNGTAAQKFSFTQVGNGVYTITNVNSSKNVAVRDGSTLNSAAVVQMEASTSAAQQWQVRAAGNGLVTLLNVGSNKALDVPGAGVGDLVSLWIYESNGSVAQQWRLNQVGGPERVDVYRLYNKYTGLHHYTSSSSERSDLVKNGWKDEGVSFSVVDQGTPVYRLYNPYTQNHLLTESGSERKDLLARGWHDEKIAWYVPANGSVKVYRLYNRYTQEHIFTTDLAEYEQAAAAGWSKEQVAWRGV